MSITPKGMSIQEAYRLYREGKLIVNRKYQRKLVWTNEEKELLIDSILRGYPIPLILLAQRPTLHGYGTYEILDGVQRLTSIFDFIENRVTYKEEYFDVQEFTTAKYLADAGAFEVKSKAENNFINIELCAKFLDYQLAITVYPAMAENEIIDVFGRINSQGRQLSNQERRQAGVINEFSSLVRKISIEIRGDVSKEILKLYEMPSISMDDYRDNMHYSIKIEDIFWCKTGILGKNELRDSEDEEMIADIIASIVMNEPFPRSRVAFDEVYNENSEKYIKIKAGIIKYGSDELYKNIVYTFSILKEIIESIDKKTNGFRIRVSGQYRNSVKSSFYELFMSVYKLIFEEDMIPDNYKGIMESLTGLQKKLTNSANFAKVTDRIKNIDMTQGLIRRYFIKKDTASLKHGLGMIIDFENSIRRSKSETTRYEFKQGFITMDGKFKLDEKLIQKIINTIAAIANSAQGEDGYLLIGIADKQTDAERVNQLYGINYIEKYGKYIVGIDREIKKMKWSIDQYMRIFIDKIKNSKMDDPLRTQILSQIDIIQYMEYSIIRVRIPKQDKLTLVDDKVFVRNNNDTKELTNTKEILAMSKMFK